MPLPLAIITFIAGNPGVVAAFIGLLVTVIGMLLGSYSAFVSRRVRDLEDCDRGLGNRLSTVENTLGRIAEHTEGADNMLRSLVARVERHMHEEEDRVWTGIQDLNTRLTEIHTDNIEAHRLIGERLAKVENRMPNGELSRLTVMLESLITQVKK